MIRCHPTVKTPTITCDGCGKVVDRKNGIYMYEFECCSNKCIEPLRKKRQCEEKAAQEAREAKCLSNGVYNMGGGFY